MTGQDLALRVEVLGPVRAWLSGRELDLGAPRQRAVLAVLAFGAGRPVSRSEIIDAVWGDDPPASAENGVYIYVKGLRRGLEPHRGRREPGRVLVSAAAGYALVLQPGGLDANVFEMLVSQARDRRAAGDLAGAARLLDEALALWRAAALEGIAGPWAEIQRVRLGETRLAAVEERTEVLLGLGRHARLVAELRALAAQYPLRERFAGQLMVALYRCGRQAEALEVFADTRRVLDAELGVEPGTELRRLHAQILASDAALDPPPASDPAALPPHPAAAASVPAQLPPDQAGFTGRREYLDGLSAMLPRMGARDSGAVVVHAITGQAGAGKTALAVHWAHQVRAHFPDGQLYVNLHGYSAVPPLPPLVALTAFLAALGVTSEQMPATTDQASTLYRTLLAGKRVLVVLDNARSPEQVRPLLPASGNSVVVVTSRDSLAGLVALDGSHSVDVPVLTPDEACSLLSRVITDDRTAREPQATADLAAACGYLPLALRIAAANLQADHARAISSYLAELAGGDRLASLGVPGDPQASVRNAFTLSYASLDPPCRRAFALLALTRGQDWTVEVAAALLDSSRAVAARMLSGLTAVHLIAEHIPGRYAFHDLLREFAAECERDHVTPAQTWAARARMLDYYLLACLDAARLNYPHQLRLSRSAAGSRRLMTPFSSPGAALAWVDGELGNLVAEAVYAAESGPLRASWQLADSLRGYFWLRRPAYQWLATGTAALAAARVASDQAAMVSMAGLVGTAHWALGNYAAAVTAFSERLELAQGGPPEPLAGTLGNLAGVLREMGRLEESEQYGMRALMLYRDVRNGQGEANTLLNLAGLAVDMGKPREGLDLARQALGCYHRLGIPDAIGAAHLQLAEAHLALDQAAEAIEQVLQARDTFAEIQAVTGEANALILLAQAEYLRGRASAGLRYAARAAEMAEGVENAQLRSGAAVACGNGYARSGDLAAAQGWYDIALTVARKGMTPHTAADALIGLAEVSRQLGDTATTRAYALEAVALAQAARLHPREARAYALLTGLAPAVPRPGLARRDQAAMSG